MFSNSLRAALRNLRKFRLFTIINLIGLSVSVMFCMLLFLHIRHEQSYDSFHENKDRIFRLEMTQLSSKKKEEKKKNILSAFTSEDPVKNTLVFPIIVANDLARNFGEIEYVTPLKDEGSIFSNVNGQIFKEEHTLFVGRDFFKSFSFKLLRGNPSTVLEDPNSVVLAASVAKKYFGSSDPLGRVILFPDRDSMLRKVSGVVEDAIEVSGINYDLIFPVEGNPEYEESVKQGFNWMNNLMMVQLKPGVDAADLRRK